MAVRAWLRKTQPHLSRVFSVIGFEAAMLLTFVWGAV